MEMWEEGPSPRITIQGAEKREKLRQPPESGPRTRVGLIRKPRREAGAAQFSFQVSGRCQGVSVPFRCDPLAPHAGPQTTA